MFKMTYEELLAIKEINEYPKSEHVDIIGYLIDFSFDNSNIKGIEHAFRLAQQIDYPALSQSDKIGYHYDLSNGWNSIISLKYTTPEDRWDFQMKEITKVIFHLRKATSIEGFDTVDKERKCQIYTNLANTFSLIGRFVEAQELWTKALEIIPHFPMALGNKGVGLFHYGQYLFDEGHKDVFILYSYFYLSRCIELKNYMEDGAAKYFHHYFDNIGTRVPKKYRNKLPRFPKHSLGRHAKLRKYRLWALQGRLYLNPLNDLGPHAIASHDCLNLPKLTFIEISPPVYLTFFNQIKQEFSSARFMYFESTENNRPHYSDVDTPILETNEGALYSYPIEQLKASFRSTYSILDKIAFLLNDYLELKVPEKKVSFRTIWYDNYEKRVLRNFFTRSDNWALRGLFWLSKDLYEKGDDFDSVIEPESQEIAEIRNHIEHKAFKIVSENPPEKFLSELDLSYCIGRLDFERKCLKLLGLTRAAIIYLSLAIDKEEAKRDYSNVKVIPVVLDEVDHGRKH